MWFKVKKSEYTALEIEQRESDATICCIPFMVDLMR